MIFDIIYILVFVTNNLRWIFLLRALHHLHADSAASRTMDHEGPPGYLFYFRGGVTPHPTTTTTVPRYPLTFRRYRAHRPAAAGALVHSVAMVTSPRLPWRPQHCVQMRRPGSAIQQRQNAIRLLFFFFFFW